MSKRSLGFLGQGKGKMSIGKSENLIRDLSLGKGELRALS